MVSSPQWRLSTGPGRPPCKAQWAHALACPTLPHLSLPTVTPKKPGHLQTPETVADTHEHVLAQPPLKGSRISDEHYHLCSSHTWNTNSFLGLLPHHSHSPP